MSDALEMGVSASNYSDQNPAEVSFLSKIDKWSWAAFIAPSDNMLQKSSGFASLDYDTIYNDGELHYLDKRKLGRSVWGFTGTTFIRWFIFVFIGVITGALGRFMELSIAHMHTWRNMAFDRFVSPMTYAHFRYCFRAAPPNTSATLCTPSSCFGT